MSRAALLLALLLGAGAAWVACEPSCGPNEVSCEGRTVDVSQDPLNCGGCGNLCADGASCACGACQCPAGQKICGGACVDLQADPSHCGACGVRCPSGEECSAGACGCGAGRSRCGSECRALASDGLNCGSCGNACPVGGRCVDGACVDAGSSGGVTPVDGGTDGGVDGGLDAGVDGGVCRGLGDGCAGAWTACCSGYCDGVVCAAAPTGCRPVNATCAGAGQCCSAICRQQRCLACIPDDSPCSAGAASCCSGYCYAGWCRAAPSGCRREDGSCGLSSQCCSRSCSVNDGGEGRCLVDAGTWDGGTGLLSCFSELQAVHHCGQLCRATGQDLVCQERCGAGPNFRGALQWAPDAGCQGAPVQELSCTTPWQSSEEGPQIWGCCCGPNALSSCFDRGAVTATTCSAYCTSLGKSCAEDCTTDSFGYPGGSFGWENGQLCDAGTSRQTGTCSTSFSGQTGVTYWQCCCR